MHPLTLGAAVFGCLLSSATIAHAETPKAVPNKRIIKPIRTVPVRAVPNRRLKRPIRKVPVMRRPIKPLARSMAACRPGELLDAKRANCFWIETKAKATGAQAMASCKARGMELTPKSIYPNKTLLKGMTARLKGKQFLAMDRKSKKTFVLLDGLGDRFMPKRTSGAGEKPAHYLCRRVAAGTCRPDELKDKSGSCFYVSPTPATGPIAKKVCAKRGLKLADMTRAHLALTLNFAVSGPLQKKFGAAPALHMGLYDKASKSILFGFTQKVGIKYRQVALPQNTKAKFLCHAKYTMRKP